MQRAVWTVVVAVAIAAIAIAYQSWIGREANAIKPTKGSKPMRLTIIGLVLIGYGVFYLLKPTVYRRGLWMKTSIAIRTLSEEGYKRYMKGLGIAFILVGLGCVAWEHGLGKLLGPV